MAPHGADVGVYVRGALSGFSTCRRKPAMHMAATNKCLAQSNKSCSGGRTTKKSSAPSGVDFWRDDHG